MSDAEDKRVSVRCTLLTRVDSIDRAPIHGRARDLSATGLGMYTEAPVGVGTPLDLVISLALGTGNASVRVQGEVRHCVYVAAQKRYRIGLRFTNCDDNATRLITAFVQERSRKAA